MVDKEKLIAEHLETLRAKLRERPDAVNGYHLNTWTNFAKGLAAALEASKPDVPDGMTLVPTEILDRFPEINPSNYDHDDVCELNSWGVELVLAATPATPVQPEVPTVDAGQGERERFEIELRKQCFQKPTPEAYDLAWCMWQARAALSSPAPVPAAAVSVEGDKISLSTFAWGVTRMGDNPKAVLVSFRSEPTDDDLRKLHEALRPASMRVVHVMSAASSVGEQA